MIKINLHAEVREAYKKKSGGGGGAAGEGLANLNNALIGVMLLIGLAYCGWVFLSLSGEKKDVQERIRQAEVERDNLKKVLEEVARFEKRKESLQRKIDLINQLKANQKGPVRIMDEISREVPDLLWLDNIDLKVDALTIKGRALNLNSVGTFIDNLKSNPYFSEPVLRDISRTAGPSYSFQLTLSYAPPKAPAPEGEGSV